jgi:hypothetical protein
MLAAEEVRDHRRSEDAAKNQERETKEEAAAAWSGFTSSDNLESHLDLLCSSKPFHGTRSKNGCGTFRAISCLGLTHPACGTNPNNKVG